MTTETIAHSQEHDKLFQMYGGTLHISKVAEPRCGYRAIVRYAIKENESMPLSPERMKEIEMLLAGL